jgi:multiple sugar transport system ATP-binding protein
MDEPLSNLDLELRARLRREIKRVQRETKITTIIVTHDQEEAMSLADRIFVMQGGEIQQGGDHRALYERPANRFVAGFIGMPSMNFADQLAIADGWLESGGVRLLRVSEGGELAGRNLSGAVLGVRPEHVAVAPEAGAGVPAVVVDLVPEGREIVVGLELEGGIELRTIVSSTVDLELGQAVGAAIDEAFIHLFDRETGAAVHHGSYRGAAGAGQR